MSSDLSRWLGGAPPLPTNRAQADIAEFYTFVRKEDRASLTKNELTKLKLRAEEGLASKFSLMEAIDQELDKNQLAKVYAVTLLIQQFQDVLRDYDMHEIFTIPSSVTSLPSENVS